jgi:hypothetical protein
VSFSPPSYDGAGTERFFAAAPNVAEIITWAGDWDELSADGGPAVSLRDLALGAGMDMMAVVGPFSDGHAIRPVDEASDRYIANAAEYAARYTPRYMTLGVEVDTAYRREPDEFERFVGLFSDAAEAVHQASPSTQVMVAFQLESMKGRRDGIINEGISDPTWELIDLFPEADIIAFTSYPGLIYTDPADIPDDYYAEILDYVDRPVAMLELGWHSGPIGAPDWDSDPTEQGMAIDILLERLDSIDPVITLWSFLWDPPSIAPFDTMGLIDAGTEPPSAAWNRWIAHWAE